MNIFKRSNFVRSRHNRQEREGGIEETFFAPVDTTQSYIGVALSRGRLLFIRGGIVLILGIILARSLQLQILQFSTYRLASDRNRLRDEYAPAQRGIITDRHGTPLVQNVASFSLVVIPADLPAPGPESQKEYQQLNAQFVGDLTLLTNLDAPTARRRREIALPIFLTHDQAIDFTLHQQEYPGVHLQVIPTRQYTAYPQSLSHVLGYVGYPSSEQVDTNDTLLPYSLVGKSGLELQYDTNIRGEDGSIQWEHDSKGQRTRKVSQTLPVQGSELKTTIDLPIQIATEQALLTQISNTTARRGSAIVMNANSGEVLALVSLPAFSSNSFTLPDQSSERVRLLKDLNHPLFFRAVAGQYPSGSVIKPFIAATALDNGVINEQTTVFSAGGVQLGAFFFPDWKAGGHGITNVIKALAQSVNTFFYLVVGGDIRSPSQWNRPALGVERFRKGLELFGWARPTGIDLPQEASGFLPSEQWKKDVKGERWYIGDTYHIAIGQGDVLVTPLQIATATARIASDGQRIHPWIVQKPMPSSERILSQKTFDIVKKGMREAVLGGSARRLADLPFPVWAKTGTAQLGGSKPNESWLTAFATIQTIPIVVTVLVEEGGEGSGLALSAVKEIYQHLAAHPDSLQ